MSTLVGTVPELLIRAAWSSPETVALRTTEESITYRELLERARTTAEELRRAGAAPGAGVGVCLPNGVAWLVAYWGATLNHNIVVPLSPRASSAEVERQLAQAQVVAVLREEGLLTLGHKGLSLGGEVKASADEGATIHLVQYTSGSTGEPKGAMLTHRGLLRAAAHQAEAWGLTPGEAVFVPNPFCHILGLVYGVLLPATARATALTLPRFDLEAALELLAAGGAVALTGAPTHLQMMAERIEHRALELPALRLGFTGGAPIAPEWVDRVRKALGLEALVNGYGMSEVGSIAHTRRDDPPEQVAASVGFLVPGLDGRIVDRETGAELPAGEVGELWLHGPSVMRGYLRNPARTREALVEEEGGPWLRTRDLMRRDANGRLSFVGRLDDRLTVGGFKVYPAEIERTLLHHPDVARAAVIGVAHDRLGSVPVAFVCVRQGGEDGTPDVAPLLAHCRAELRHYAVPRHITVLGELPVNRAGKVDKLQLEELAEGIHVD